MRFSQSYSLIFYGLLLAGPMVMSLLVPGVERTLETATDLKASMAARHGMEGDMDMALMKRPVPPEEILKMPIENRPNLWDRPPPTPPLTEHQKMLAWGNSYGYGGKICGAIWRGIKTSCSWFFKKLTYRFDPSLSDREYQLLREAEQAHALPPHLLHPTHSSPQGDHYSQQPSVPYSHPNAPPPFTPQH
ncbi:hypothetical protein VP01_158g14 [Puccinia sorghi]|uniref:Uncharacterized protein n=1 Tax=Puccinia sorghi TaxID=27349 RepID=A0A0L6VJC6_9BASI|nr:hypothetical protein VP01_158g14 [Puccinia sorghi]